MSMLFQLELCSLTIETSRAANAENGADHLAVHCGPRQELAGRPPNRHPEPGGHRTGPPSIQGVQALSESPPLSGTPDVPG